ncbi:MAG: S-layer homology domain-containing protein, partial [Candidatus Limnocylindrales bacterium]
MRVTIEIRRPARRTVALLLGALLLAIPGVALANHQFGDVPNSNVFHDQISAMAGAGITAGFGDGGFHPSDPVTRQSMAAFMQRGLGRAAITPQTAPITPTITAAAGFVTSGAAQVRQLTITVPGTTNGFAPQQLVHLQGRVALSGTMNTSADGCPCEFQVMILDTDNFAQFYQLQTFESISTQPFVYMLDLEALFLA